MDTNEAMAALRRMMNDRKLSASDAAALDVVDRMLRDLRAAQILKNAVSAGLISPEEHDEKLRRLPTFIPARSDSGAVESPVKCCGCIHPIGQALDLAASRNLPLTLIPQRVEHDYRWAASLGGTSRRGCTPGDAANELLLAHVGQSPR